ncbi:MAG: trypsin-like peptidase domain-containing protein [Patescibacteria group bacterium]|nr:trypsin-like peptidase domain-containing protein [Patescibacteria group bacterium]
MSRVSKIEYSENMPFESNNEDNSKKGRGGVFVIVFLILALVMGLVGGIFGMTFIFSNENLRNKLHIKGVNVNTTTTDKLVLEESSAVIDATKKVSPAVVSVLSKKDIENFFGQVYEQKGGGTGFIITSDGLILTNKHVVSDETAEYTVFTADGKDYKAKIMATDAYNDLAVIKIEATGLPVVELGDSDKLEIGQWVIAIGNALAEFQNSVTVGVISAKDREITASGGGASEQLVGLLQTDAAINSGNSGGPLINLKGQVIGINTAVATNAQNIGFAIPINSAKTAIESIKKTGKIVRPFMGIRSINITKELAKANNLSVDHGALVYHGSGTGEFAVTPSSPADKAGIQENDIILSINGEEINENRPITQIIQKYNPGDEIELTVLRKGKESKVKLTLGESK